MIVAMLVLALITLLCTVAGLLSDQAGADGMQEVSVLSLILVANSLAIFTILHFVLVVVR